jgi:hypothetical protein
VLKFQGLFRAPEDHDHNFFCYVFGAGFRSARKRKQELFKTRLDTLTSGASFLFKNKV